MNALRQRARELWLLLRQISVPARRWRPGETDEEREERKGGWPRLED